MSKIWKKLLMAICIIAILFNIVSKLITRTNLKDQLRAVIGRDSIFTFFDKKEEPGKEGSSSSNGDNGSINGSTEFIEGVNQNGNGSSSSQNNGRINSETQINGQELPNGQTKSGLDEIEDVAGNVLTNAGEKISEGVQNINKKQETVIDRGTRMGEEYQNAYKEGIGDWPSQIGNYVSQFFN